MNLLQSSTVKFFFLPGRPKVLTWWTLSTEFLSKIKATILDASFLLILLMSWWSPKCRPSNRSACLSLQVSSNGTSMLMLLTTKNTWKCSFICLNLRTFLCFHLMKCNLECVGGLLYELCIEVFCVFFSWHVISQSKGPSKTRVLAAEQVLFFKSIFQHRIHLGMAFHWILGPSIFDHTTDKNRVKNLHLQPFMHKN